MFADLRYALRLLLKSPGFTLVAILTLSIGIGSATVVFTAVNALLFRPFPHVPAERLERLVNAYQVDRQRNYDQMELNYADFLDLRSRLSSLEGLWTFSDRTVIIAGSSQPERVLGTDIDWDAFHHLGVQPLLGRHFTPADGAPGAPAVALVSHELWQRRYGGDAGIVGAKVTFNSVPVTVIGVMPPRWRYPEITDVWLPMQVDPDKLHRGSYYLKAQGLLKPGATLATATQEAQVVMAALALEFPTTNSAIGARFTPARTDDEGQTRRLTQLLFGAVLFVFLIASVNVASLSLARAFSRSKEFALRAALGAEQPRLVRLLVLESLLLALGGAVGGLLLALWSVDGMTALIPVPLPFWLEFGFDHRVFVFVVVLALVTALITGLLPALRTTRPALATDLKEGGRGGDSGATRGLRLRHSLVILEIALALVLLVGAGLMMRSFLRLRGVEPGYDAQGVLTFRVGFPLTMIEGEGRDPGLPARFFATLPERLAAIPQVERAGIVSILPGSNGGMTVIEFEGRETPTSHADAPLMVHREVGGDYFGTLRIPLLRGRAFDAAMDRADTPHVTVVDESLAWKFYGGAEQALGRRIRYYDPQNVRSSTAWMEIIGVVGDVRHALERDFGFATFYTPVAQGKSNFLSVVLRTQGDPATFITAARDAVLTLQPDLPIYYEMTLEDLLLRTIWPRMFFGVLFTVFGLVALFLACTGIYGVMAYSVAQRTQELGVRMALGAQPREVIRLVVAHGIKLVGWGLGSGLIAAALLANLLAGVLYEVSPHDPPTFAVVPLLLAVVALVACYLPTRRATRLDPLVALRGE